MRLSRIIPVLFPLFVVGKPQVPLVRISGETTCLGVAITRHHVITTKQCMTNRDSVMIDMVGKTGRRSRGSLLLWDHPNLAVLGLERGLSGGGGLDLGVPQPGSVIVKGEGQQLPCNLNFKANLVQCEELIVQGSLVLQESNLVGLLGTNGSFYSINSFSSSLSDVVGEDLAKRSKAGGRGILRCRPSEKLAVQMLVASHSRIKTGKSMTSFSSGEVMLQDDSRKLSTELTKVIEDLKSEIAGKSKTNLLYVFAGKK